MNNFFERSLADVENRLGELTDGFNCTERLKQAMTYSLMACGKRLRPLLILTAANLAGLRHDEVLDMACAVEMIHTYSLIHDDLPSMDDDALRRGKPTSHMVFGEAMAILAGDALLNEAHKLLIERYAGNAAGARAALEISRAAGKDGMINGQVLDITHEGSPVSLETLKMIHAGKTGALIAASLTAPYLLAGKTPEEVRTIRQIGENIGVMFQIQDDILDVTSDAKTLGKTPGKDQRDAKNTYVSLLGLPESRRLIDEYYRGTLELISMAAKEHSLLTELLNIILKRSK